MTAAPGNQYLEDIVADGHGGAFLVWYDWPNYDVYAQHVLESGQIAPGWPANGLPVSVAPGAQLKACMLPDGAGGVYVAWEDGDLYVSRSDVYAQHLSGDGTRVAGWPAGGLAVCTAPGFQESPYLASDGKDGVFVAWADYRIVSWEISAQRLTWSGDVVAGWPVNGKPINAGGGSAIRGMVPDATGGAYIGWKAGTDPNSTQAEVYATRIMLDGTIAPGWPAGGLRLTQGVGYQELTSVVADSTGGVLLAWYDQFVQPAVVHVQRLRPNGAIAPGWPAGGARVSDIAGWQDLYRDALAPDGQGGAYVVFEVLPGSGSHGYVQHLTASGVPALGWPTSGVPLVTPAIFYAFQQSDLAIAPDGAGGAIAAWNDFRVVNNQGNDNQIYAQRFFGVGPTPVLVSLASLEALPDRVTLTWYFAGGALPDATVSRRREGEDWVVLGRTSFDGTGRLRYEDAAVTAGARYAYRLGWLESGTEQFSAEIWVDVPAALKLALEGARPNPAVGPLTVAFTLPRSEPATLELLDVSGRLVHARDVGSLGPGSHVMRLGECGCTPPGLYWLRLTEAGRSLVKRAIIVR